MTFEERLVKTDLTLFKQPQVKEDLLGLLVKQIYRYQNFKTKVALSKINHMHYGSVTVMNYLHAAKKYLACGETGSHIPTNVYRHLDKLKANHEAILTPAENEKARPYKPRKQFEDHPTPPEPVEVPKYIEIAPDQYGVKIQNTIKLFANKEACDAYIECYKEFNKDKIIELVKVEIENV